MPGTTQDRDSTMENDGTNLRPWLRPKRNERLHDQQLNRDVKIVNEGPPHSLGSSSHGGLPTQTKRIPNFPMPVRRTPETTL